MQAGADSVPLIIERDPDDPDFAVVIVEGTVAGRPYRFVLDTGAARTQPVSDDFTSRLSSDMQESSSGGVFAPSHNALITVSDLFVGPLAETSLEVVRADAADRGVDNLLGMDVLRRRCCHFQFDRNTLVVEQTPATQAVNPLRMDERGHFYVDANWPSVTARACWDSGAGITIVDQAIQILRGTGLRLGELIELELDCLMESVRATRTATSTHSGSTIFRQVQSGRTSPVRPHPILPTSALPLRAGTAKTFSSRGTRLRCTGPNTRPSLGN